MELFLQYGIYGFVLPELTHPSEIAYWHHLSDRQDFQGDSLRMGDDGNIYRWNENG